MDLGLERIEAVLKALKLETPVHSAIHVAGTNGKGSTALFLTELAKLHGLRAGLYTSPHFLSPRERIRVDGRMLSEADWVNLANQVRAASKRIGPTYFEFITAMAALAFAQAKVDLGLLEAGLGGRFDATRALAADLTLFTKISLDHENVLGHSLAEIARDKAGAIRPRSEVICAPQDPEVWKTLRDEAENQGARIRLSSDVLTVSWSEKTMRPAEVGGPELDRAEVRTMGSHQRENAHLALSAWYALAKMKGFEIKAWTCEKALAKAWLPGRLQRIPGNPDLLLDGAHNEGAMQSLANALSEENIMPEALIFTCLKDKNLDRIAPLAKGLTRGPIYVPGLAGISRARPPKDLALTLGPRAVAVADVAEALKRVREIKGWVVICGSLYLLAEFFKLRPECLREPSEIYHLQAG